MTDPAAVARSLAERHAGPRPADDGIRLVDYAESSRVGDWSLRSALVRFAQPEPMRASAVLELVRRTDAALHPHRRLLESTLVPTDPALGPDLIGPDGSLLPVAASVSQIRLDARAADLARVMARLPDGAAVVEAYADDQDLADAERATVGVLTAALALDALADELASWALDRQGPPPVALVDGVAGQVFGLLESLDVPRETRPAGRGRRGPATG